jgi:hypothetical protein
MAQKGTWLDPQAGLVMENYLLNKERFLGTPGFTEEAFQVIKEIIPMYHDFMKRALKIPRLKIVFGSDALAGSHGRNPDFRDTVIARDGNQALRIQACSCGGVLNGSGHGYGGQNGLTQLCADRFSLPIAPLCQRIANVLATNFQKMAE